MANYPPETLHTKGRAVHVTMEVTVLITAVLAMTHYVHHYPHTT